MSAPARPRGHQAERGEGRVATADVGVGVDDAVAAGAGLLVERAAGVGDDDDPGRRVDPGLGEGGLEGAPLRVGLDRGAGLARDDDDRALEVGDRGAHHVGLRGVEHDEVDAGGARR